MGSPAYAQPKWRSQPDLRHVVDRHIIRHSVIFDASQRRIAAVRASMSPMTEDQGIISITKLSMLARVTARVASLGVHESSIERQADAPLIQNGASLT